MARDSSSPPARIKSVASYLAIKNAAEAMHFYKEAFGAVEDFRLTGADGKIAHAEMSIGGSLFMVADEFPDFGALGPVSIGGSPVKFTIETDDAESLFTHAIKIGCTELRGLEDQFYGFRGGMVTDPFGYSWFIQQKIEDVSPEEMQVRWSKIQGDS